MAEEPGPGVKIGIVTVLYNSGEVVEDFFASLGCQQHVSFKLYVIDNSATPDTLERCRELAVTHGVEAEFVFNGANLGVAKGNNQGIALALAERCEQILLANNDTEFAAGTLAALLQAAHQGEQIVTPKILYYGPQRLIWYAGGRIDSWTMRTPHIGMLRADRGQYDQAGYTGYAPTCFLLVNADVFKTVGVMDETYFVYYDDTDFMWRLRRSGLRIRYAPNAIVQHKVSTSTGGGESPFTVYYTNRNRVYFIRKNFTGARRWIALGYTLLTRWIRSIGLPRPLSRRLWDGIKDGLRLPVNVSVR
jgi:GT2 family glycosyltransferase